MARAKKPTTDQPQKRAPKRASTAKRAPAELPPQPDPRAPLDVARFIAALQPVRKHLEDDLLARAQKSPAITAALTARHAADVNADRTADPFVVWQRRFVEQLAAAWILSCVFVRTLEDRGLLDHARIAGPGAIDAQRSFLELAPSLSERDYLLTIFREMTRLPAAASLFDHHDPVWMLAPSAEGARALLSLFRAGSDEAPAYRFGQPDTRFLGDLYQDLNESVRERFALLQTPDFVERFILDRTLGPALERFGLDETDLVDPTCGSGHFLLGAFDRLFERVQRDRPHLAPFDAALCALDKVYGADINPYAVAIAKFRLTLSFLDKAGFAHIADAPELPLHVAVADSLLYNPQHVQRSLFQQEGVEAAAWEGRAFSFESEREARAVLDRTYAAVVGNPPYITVKDAALRESYRKLYSTAFRSYSLSVPFCERFFQLAKKGGRVGQITANSFMKREFGKKLIEEYLPDVNLDLIVNTSGAYIPGHGTPTVLLFGSPDAPVGTTVRAVLAKRGEPTTPEDPSKGQVWSSIAHHFDEVGFENDFISVAEVERSSLKQHPWSLGGGGAAELKELLESRAAKQLADVCELPIGRAARTGGDEVYAYPPHVAARLGVPEDFWRDLLIGEAVRDWGFGLLERMLFPYTTDLVVANPDQERVQPLLRVLWPYRTLMANRATFQGRMSDAGLQWFEYMQYTPSANKTALSIAFAEVATHNHFVLDRGGKVFKQTAPIIKLPETATEDDHLALLAYLNSSTAGFYLRQVCHSKGSQAVNEGHKSEEWEQFLEYSGTLVGALPVPARDSAAEHLAWWIDTTASALTSVRGRMRAGGVDRAVWLSKPLEARNTCVMAQEELDWRFYELLGLLTDPDAHAALRLRAFPEFPATHTPAQLEPGHRAFEIAMLEAGAPTQWFARNGYTTDLDGLEAKYGAAYCALVRWRVEEIRRNKQLALIESPVCKRRWTPLDLQREWDDALRDRQLAACERQLAQRDEPVRVASFEIDGIERPQLAALIAAEAVAFLAAYRHTDKGLEKRAAWERTWALQSREDAGENVGEIPVPPKYDPKDFRDAAYYRLRGKLDVPKERFISYPGCESDDDAEPVYGWAGWDHAQRAAALVALYNDRKLRESWPKDRLIPMLAGLLELLPWLEQWHSHPMPDYDTTVFEAYEAFLTTELRDLELTRDHLTTHRPPERRR